MHLASLLFGGGSGGSSSSTGAQVRDSGSSTQAQAPSYSFERLQTLYARLAKFRESDLEKSSDAIVETVRQITEAVIWGEQNDTNFFDFFCEKRILADFIRVLGHQKAPKMVKVQLLQTLSMLVQNLKEEHSVFYLLSGGHINKLIEMRLDFTDEEILAYYITFLKSLAMRLNNKTVQFFYIDKGKTPSFPLYMEATRFFNHRDQMVRAAVRTITLQVFRVGEERVQKFVLRHCAESYIGQLVQHVQELWERLDASVGAGGDEASAAQRDNELQQDLLVYLSDVFELGVLELNQLLATRLLGSVMFPLLLGGVAAYGGKAKLRLEGNTLSPLVALFLLRQVFDTFKSALLLEPLATALLKATVPEAFVRTLPLLPGGERPQQLFTMSALRPSNGAALVANPLRPWFLRCLRSREDGIFVYAASVVHSCFCSRAAAALPELELAFARPESFVDSSSQERQGRKTSSLKRGLWPRSRARSSSRSAAESPNGDSTSDGQEPQEVLAYILEGLDCQLSWRLDTLQVFGRIVQDIFVHSTVMERSWCAQAAAAALHSALQASASALRQTLNEPRVSADMSEQERILDLLFEEWNPGRQPLVWDVGSVCSDTRCLLSKMRSQGIEQQDAVRKAACSLVLWLKVLEELQQQASQGPFAQLAQQLKEVLVLVRGGPSPLQIVEERAEDLKEGNSIDASQADQRVLCSVLAGGVTQTRFFVKRSVWLLLVKQDATAQGKYLITTVWPMRLVQSMVDRSDPRTLLVGMQVPRGAARPGEVVMTAMSFSSSHSLQQGGSDYGTLALSFKDVETSHEADAHLQRCRHTVRQQLVGQALNYLQCF